MRYNTKIEKTINELSNSECRIALQNLTDPEDYIHDNQIEAAKEIIKSFTAHERPDDEDSARNYHTILVAKMQSGKTGTCNAVINILEKDDFKYFKINKYFFITGMNDNGLHDQTVKRLKNQVFEANNNNVVDGEREIKEKPNGKFFVQKNSDLRKNNIELKNCIIFIDESHYGSNKNNVLTLFLEKNKLNWKNDLDLKKNHVYIVSVSATPFDEVISDTIECKYKVELVTDKNYFGVTQFDDNGQLFCAKRSDFIENKKTGVTPIIEYIKEAHIGISNNKNKGVIFIRSGDKKIRNNEYILKNFECIQLDTSKGGSIDYKRVSEKIDLMLYKPIHKPIIFFIKGAYRAGITLESQHKDVVFLVYDNSNKPEATAQGLLGRMCGYRKDDKVIKNTTFYINKEHAQAYANWEQNGFVRQSTPSKSKWENVELSEKIDTNNFDTKIATKGVGNHTFVLTNDEVKRFTDAWGNKKVKNREFVQSELKLLNMNRIINFDFDFNYIGYCFIGGYDEYSSASQESWFGSYNKYTDTCPSYNPTSTEFYNDTNRNFLNTDDLGKKIIHVVLDDRNNSLRIYCGEIILQRKVKTLRIIEHKNTYIQNKVLCN